MTYGTTGYRRFAVAGRAGAWLRTEQQSTAPGVSDHGVLLSRLFAAVDERFRAASELKPRPRGVRRRSGSVKERPTGDALAPSRSKTAGCFSIGIGGPGPLSLVTTPNPTAVTLGREISNGGLLLGNALSYAAGGNTGTTPIALLGPDYSDDVSDVENTLADYGGFSVTSLDVEDSTPTLRYLGELQGGPRLEQLWLQ